MRLAIPPETRHGRTDASHRWWTLAVIGSGTFMSALDTSIVNLALPVIHNATQAAVSTVEWVSLAYLITVSSALLLFGRLADIYGRRRIYMAGQLVFVLGSLACGVSGHVGMLIASRVVQALGASMIFALSPAILVSAFPANERGRALGLQATMTYLGMTLGPGVGGLLVGQWGWSAIFFVNVPVGLVMFAVAAAVLRPDDREAGRQAFDPAGAVTLALTLASLLLALSKGGELGWGHPVIAAAAAVAAGAGAAFVAIECRVAQPALDLRLFLNRTFSTSVLAAYLCYLATAAVGFLMPFFLLAADGYSAPRAGWVLMAVPLGMMMVTGPSGWLSDKIGVRVPTTAGMGLMAVGIGLLGGLQLGDATGWTMACLACVGVGAGLFTAPNNSAIMGEVAAGRRGVAGAVLSAARTTGFASGIALAGLIYLACQDTASGGHGEAVAHAVRMGLRVTVAAALLGMACSALRGRGAKRPDHCRPTVI